MAPKRPPKGPLPHPNGPFQPRSVSDKYFVLADRVKRRFPNDSDEDRSMIFALAYWAYCTDKKERIDQALTSNADPYQVRVTEVHNEYTESQIDDLVTEADEVYRRLVSRWSESAMLRAISTTIKSSLPTVPVQILYAFIGSLCVPLLGAFVVWAAGYGDNIIEIIKRMSHALK
jgi:hypothetical protein